MMDAVAINQSVSKTGESVDQVIDLVLKNGRITLHELAKMLEILFRSVQSIFKDSLNV
jgi:transcription initiation factor IIE alpha subunit